MQQYFSLASRNAEAARLAKSNVANRYVRVRDADHTTVCFDKPAVQMVITEVVNYFNRICDERQAGRGLF